MHDDETERRVELSLSAEQTEITEAVAAFLAKELPFERVRLAGSTPLEPSLDDDTWRRCADLGWFGLGLPEEAGGVGYGLVEEVLLARELGRHLTPGPFLATIAAAHVAHAAGAASLVGDLLSGDVRVGVAIGDRALDAEAGGMALAVGETARVVPVLELEPVPCLDATVRLGRAVFGDPVAQSEAADVVGRFALLQASAALGVAEAVLHDSAEYAKERVQFGRPIGSFQAVKHRCADMAIRAHAAFAQLAVATLEMAAGTPDAPLHADAAVLLCLDAARENTAANIQVHGGIGFTEEHSAGWYLKRAQVLEQVAGDMTSRHRRVVSAPKVGFE